VRWVATALLEAQNRFRLKGYRHLPRFLAALEDAIAPALSDKHKIA